MSILSLIFFCVILPSFVSAQQENDKDLRKIRAILNQQQKDWNNGDVDAFMEAYWKSDELQFGGADGITKGWQKTLDNYKVRYPDRKAMGQLTFNIKDITRHSRKVISLTGSWDLERGDDDIGGHFLLLWRKIKGNWMIVTDHTSQRR